VETYFRIRTFIEFGVPIIIIAAVVLWILIALLYNEMKDRLMKKLGYEYKPGLDRNVAYEFQPHWVKGHIRIHWRQIDCRTLNEIKQYVQTKEGVRWN
jgi:hypothetical protein